MNLKLEGKSLWERIKILTKEICMHALMSPWTHATTATVEVEPNSLNLKSRDKWITAYVEVPQGYNASYINVFTILLDDMVPAVTDPKYDFVANSSEYLTDRDGDGLLERMVKFDKAMVTEYIADVFGMEYGSLTLAVTGQVAGTPFNGLCTIKVLFPGDADDDGDVDFDDFTILAGCYGMSIENPSCNPLAGFDEDGHINYDDFLILAGNYGKTAV